MENLEKWYSDNPEEICGWIEPDGTWHPTGYDWLHMIEETHDMIIPEAQEKRWVMTLEGGGEHGFFEFIPCYQAQGELTEPQKAKLVELGISPDLNDEFPRSKLKPAVIDYLESIAEFNPEDYDQDWFPKYPASLEN